MGRPNSFSDTSCSWRRVYMWGVKGHGPPPAPGLNVADVKSVCSTELAEAQPEINTRLLKSSGLLCSWDRQIFTSTRRTWSLSRLYTQPQTLRANKPWTLPIKYWQFKGTVQLNTDEGILKNVAIDFNSIFIFEWNIPLMAANVTRGKMLTWNKHLLYTALSAEFTRDANDFCLPTKPNSNTKSRYTNTNPSNTDTKLSSPKLTKP